MLPKQVRVQARVILLLFSVGVISLKALIMTNSLHSNAVFQTKRAFSYTECRDLIKRSYFCSKYDTVPRTLQARCRCYFYYVSFLCTYNSALCNFPGVACFITVLLFLPGLFFSIEIWAVPCILIIYVPFTGLQCCVAYTFLLSLNASKINTVLCLLSEVFAKFTVILAKNFFYILKNLFSNLAPGLRCLMLPKNQ